MMKNDKFNFLKVKH